MSTRPTRFRTKHAVALLLWLGAVAGALRVGAWSPSDPADLTASHDSMFHMHRPLHEGGRVAMVGQFHLELASARNGQHRLWISNAFRQEMDPAGFLGTLTVEPEVGAPIRADFERVGRTRELVARTPELAGTAWLVVDGRLGEWRFDDVRVFWDYSTEPAAAAPAGLDPMVPVPADNPLSAAKVALGRDLFFDARLSADGTTSCASCHVPEHAFADARPVSRGVGERAGRRNAPGLGNVAYAPVLAWDGRVATLEEQALEALRNPDEMGADDEEALLARIGPTYGERLRSAFETPPSARTVAMALASYERTLLSGDSDFDRHGEGDDGALDAAARRGRALFFGAAGCGDCHLPPLLTDFRFHNLGVGWQGAEAGDRGRFDVTGDPADLGAFRTPSLRDVARTAPYMHDGSLATLRDVVELYDRGGVPNPAQDPRIEPLGLSEDQREDLLAFLESLVGRTLEEVEPADGGGPR